MEGSPRHFSYGPHRMEHIPDREIASPGDFGPAGGFRISLFLHQFPAGIAQLDSGHGLIRKKY